MILKGGKKLRTIEGLGASMMSLDYCPKALGSQMWFWGSGMIWSHLCIKKGTLVSVKAQVRARRCVRRLVWDSGLPSEVTVLSQGLWG